MKLGNLFNMGTESRKIATFAPVWLTFTVAFFLAKMSEAGYIEFSKWAIIALFAGLTAERFGGNGKSPTA